MLMHLSLKISSFLKPTYFKKKKTQLEVSFDMSFYALRD